MNRISTLLIIYFTLLFGVQSALSQVSDKSDSVRMLNPVTVEGLRNKQHHLPDLVGMNIFAGKKSDLITVKNENVNLPQNVGRMIFAKIPGINLWDMDGAGTQMNLGTRGTDAHRSIEMNMRQNGYATNSDVFGYPENHYTVPMQAVRQVQLIRGSAALQFGPQFGGMFNYIMKEGDSTRTFTLESEQTTGSYAFFNSYNAIGGTKGKISYYAYYDNRHGDGWRPNSAFNYTAWYGSIKYAFSPKGSLTFQYSRMDYRQQIAGGQTDAQFSADDRQSGRARNYFSPIINIPALIAHFDLSRKTQLQITSHYLWGERSSVQFINPANVKDTFNTAIGSYNPRQVDRDFYHGFTTEARLLHHFTIGSVKSALAAGVRYFQQTTFRKQKGMGTTGSDFDLSLIGPYGIDLKFNTLNVATFVEDVFWINRKFSVTPGFRYEVIQSDLTGVINGATYPVSYKGSRAFPLFGMGLQYQVSDFTQFYANVSQAYRPYLYSNITPADQIGVIDANLKDSKGYDIDAGYRGALSDLLTFDINGYYLFYGNKIGKLTMPGSGTSTYLLTTNIGNSVATGFEMYASLGLLQLFGHARKATDVRLFSSLAYTHARYTSGSLSNGPENISLVGKHVENTPDWIERGGLEFRHKSVGFNVQGSYVSVQYNDANNTTSSPSGIVGVIHPYTLWDCSFQYSFLGHYRLSGGANNLANTRYFSRRINMYPGPGILPGDGRTYYFSLGFKF